MTKKSNVTRQNILDAAQNLILQKGFGSTTIDAIIEQAGVSKGAFFHHFSNKSELAYELVHRYAIEDIELLNATIKKAERLSDDPLQQLLIFIKLFEHDMESMDEPYPGCLFASYLHQSGLFNERILSIVREWILAWREQLLVKINQITQLYRPHRKFDTESLADMMLVSFEGAFVLSQALHDPKIISNQLANYHSMLSLLFDNREMLQE